MVDRVKIFIHLKTCQCGKLGARGIFFIGASVLLLIYRKSKRPRFSVSSLVCWQNLKRDQLFLTKSGLWIFTGSVAGLLLCLEDPWFALAFVNTANFDVLTEQTNL